MAQATAAGRVAHGCSLALPRPTGGAGWPAAAVGEEMAEIGLIGVRRTGRTLALLC
jgi:hypothetical protein